MGLPDTNQQRRNFAQPADRVYMPPEHQTWNSSVQRYLPETQEITYEQNTTRAVDW